ncbi:MAG: cytochrome P450 [Chloroflexota bacterium]|nr:cytochrome P450 [Chloroflexota bacterium]
MTNRTPPLVSGGFPVIGHTFEFARDRDALFRRGFEEHGNVFSFQLMGKPFAVVTGAANNKLFYGETDKALNMDEAYDFLRATFGDILFVAGQERYQNERPLLQTLFRHDKMARYVNAMRAEVQRWLDSLGDSGEVNISAAMLPLTQMVAGHAFIGANFRDELPDSFWADYQSLSAAIDPLLPPNLPLPKFFRRDRARARMRSVFAQLIARRREHPEQYDDLITLIQTTPLKDGTFMKDEDITTLFIGLLFAGHETTAGQAGWTIIQLLQHPDYLRLVQDEIAAHVTPDMDPRGLSKLEHIYWAIDETTRMYPSADIQMRMVKAPLTVESYQVEPGWGMVVNAANSHFQADVYTQPEQYDPLRYTRGEGGGAFEIVGFGGGMHKCTGMNFAKNEMAVITMLLFQQFDLELVTTDIHIQRGVGANRPSAAWVKYRRK